MYQTVREYIGDTKDKVGFDLYSGTGTIAQIAAAVAKQVIGVEIIPEAVEAAKENAAMNGITNCTFLADDVLKALDYITEKPDLIILDPPRDGVHPKALPKILDYGVDFDRTPDGELHRTLEGGHSRHRIFHHKDATGAEILDKLLKKVKTLPNVTILEHAMMTGMQKTDTGFSVNVMQGGSCTVYSSHFMILATGGIGRVYRFTTNSKIATGDGIAFAYENGAEIRNLHLIQFHPTAFNDHHTRECFLISEAVRGEGAYLLNCNKERFMDRYDERLELAPRDVVSHAIILESRRTHSDNFYLDISYKDSEFIKNRFPMIYEKVLEQGYDMTKEPIPIFPCQHYLMGGIQVDDNSETTAPNLYAAGECSHTGVHGNNRLASNSLLEALVFSRQAALDIAKKLPDAPKTFTAAEFPA